MPVSNMATLIDGVSVHKVFRFSLIFRIENHENLRLKSFVFLRSDLVVLCTFSVENYLLVRDAFFDF